MTDQNEGLKAWPWDEFPDKGSTWRECVKQHTALQAKVKDAERLMAEWQRYVKDNLLCPTDECKDCKYDGGCLTTALKESAAKAAAFIGEKQDE